MGVAVTLNCARLGLLAAAAMVPHLALAQQTQPVPRPPTRPEVTPPVPRERVPESRVRVEDRESVPQEACPLELRESPLQVELQRVVFTDIDGGELDAGVRDALRDVE